MKFDRFARVTGTELVRVRLRSVHLWRAILFVTLFARARAAGAAIDFNTVFGAIPDTVCSLASFLAGPVGLGICLVFIAWGFIRHNMNQNGGISMAVSAFVIGLVLLALPDIAATLGAGDCITA